MKKVRTDAKWQGVRLSGGDLSISHRQGSPEKATSAINVDGKQSILWLSWMTYVCGAVAPVGPPFWNMVVESI